MDKNKTDKLKSKAEKFKGKVVKKSNGRLTTAEMQESEDAVHQRVNEFLEGYVLVGFVAGAKNELIFLSVYDDAKTGLALQKFMQNLEIIPEDPDDDDDEGGESWKAKA